ncbi:MAG TPA: sugar phosphate isomerase/epimerase family protein [Myxococcota bacterium]|nr:sugar phosphate isomerase/epimerase family protein [Myxococcota bacterium]
MGADVLGPNDLVLHAATLRNASCLELCDAAVAGGFRGVTFYPTQIRRARASGLSWLDLRSALRERGLELADLDPLLDWMPGDDFASELGASEAEHYEVAEALGARSLNVAQAFRPHVEIDAAAEALAGVCDRAWEHGLIITLEYLPWAGIPDIATARAIVERCGRPNASLMIDTWHTFRGPSTEAQLAALPGKLVGSIQINDAPAEPAGDLLTETTTARLLPGEGAIPLERWIRLLDANGCRAPIGVEVFSDANDRLPTEEVARRCGEAARRVLESARER